MPRRHLILAAALLGTGLTFPTTSPAQAESVNTPNLTHVANRAYDVVVYPSADPAFRYDADDRQGGTDLELVTIVADPDGAGPAAAGPRDFAVAGSYRNGLQLVDVTDPTNPTIAQTYGCGIAQGDVQIFTRDGRTYAAYAQDDISIDALPTTACWQDALALYGLGTPKSPGDIKAIGGYGTFIIDITNPYDATSADRVRTVGWARWGMGSHNATVDPSGQFLYNSNQDLLAKTPVNGQNLYQLEVFSLADLANPTHVANVPLSTGAGPHDITFSADGTRAYVAAVSHSVILDTTDLAAPSVIGVVEDPAISIHHQADPIDLDGRRYMVVSDELIGVIEGAAVCPGGGLHIYDVTGDLERTPLKVGVFEINQIVPPGQDHLRCTAHVFKAYPEQGIMTIAWYGAGVRVLDISALAGVSAGVSPEVGGVATGIREIASFWFPQSETQVGSQTWAAKIHRFDPDGSAYIFANDLDRGFDVYRFDAGLEVATDPGTWLTPGEAADLARARDLVATASGQQEQQALPVCVIVPDAA